MYIYLYNLKLCYISIYISIFTDKFNGNITVLESGDSKKSNLVVKFM